MEQSGNETGFFSAPFYFPPSLLFHQSSILINRSPLWRFGSILSHGGPPPLSLRDIAITPRHTTLGRTPLDEGLAQRRDLYLTTHNTHCGQKSMLLAGFEPEIPAIQPPLSAIYLLPTLHNFGI